MGLSSRDKWLARVATYEQIAIRDGAKAAKEYLDRFGKNLERFLKASVELDRLRDEESVDEGIEEEEALQENGGES